MNFNQLLLKSIKASIEAGNAILDVWSLESFPQFTLIQDKAIGQVLEIIEFIKN